MSVHKAANLVNNVRNALEGCAVRSVYGWTDSMVGFTGWLVKEATNSGTEN